jgi:hypothetical protein
MSMEMTPEGSPAKRARSKVSVKPAADAAPATKKARAPRKTLTTKAAETQPVVTEPSSEDLGGMIATAAYYLAAARNFTPGHELDDWLEAERSVRAKLYG